MISDYFNRNFLKCQYNLCGFAFCDKLSQTYLMVKTKAELPDGNSGFGTLIG